MECRKPLRPPKKYLRLRAEIWRPYLVLFKLQRSHKAIFIPWTVNRVKPKNELGRDADPRGFQAKTTAIKRS